MNKDPIDEEFLKNKKLVLDEIIELKKRFEKDCMSITPINIYREQVRNPGRNRVTYRHIYVPNVLQQKIQKVNPTSILLCWCYSEQNKDVRNLIEDQGFGQVLSIINDRMMITGKR